MPVIERSRGPPALEILGRGPLPSHYGLLVIRRTGASGLGALRQADHRPRGAAADGLRDGAVLLAPPVPALLSRRGDGVLHSRPRRGLRLVRRRAQGPAVRQFQERGARARGRAIHFHPTLLELAAHYRFQPRPVAVARGNEKGRVERAIRFVRDAFFAARRFRDLDDLNAQAAAWCAGAAAERLCPEERARTVRDGVRRGATTCWRCPPTRSRPRSASR